MSEHFPALIVAVMLFSAFLSPLLYRRSGALSAGLLTGALLAALVMAVLVTARVQQEGLYLYHMGGWPPPYGIEFRVDLLRAFMLLIVLAVSLWIFTYALQSLACELKKEVIGWYHTLYAVLVASMAAMAMTNDLFNLFVLMEICTLSACGIISIREKRECLEAAFKYLILSAMGTGCFLLGVAMLYMTTGCLNYSLLQAALVNALADYPLNAYAASALFIVAFGTKAALFPLHVWLPDAHAAAPSPSSAMLSGLVIKIFTFVLLLIYYQVLPAEMLKLLPLSEIILWLAALGSIAGSIYAMVQGDLKKMLAFSSVSQIGYVFLGIGLAQSLAVTGALYHILVHAVTKGMLFMTAGIIIHATGVRKIRDLEGIGRVLPLTMLAFTVGGASMVGIPGTGGLISKWYLALGALESGRFFFVIVILAGSLLNAIYYMPIVINAFLGREEFKGEVKPVPLGMHLPVIFGTVMVIVTGLYSRPIIMMLENALGPYF